MKTTAGICSTRARYLASTFSKGPSEFVSASGVPAASKVGFENTDGCCKNTSANSCKAFSASNNAAASRVVSVGCVVSLGQLACFRKSSAIFHLLQHWPAAYEPLILNGLHESHTRCPVRPASFLAVASPRRFLIQGRLRESTQRVNRAPIRHHRAGRKQRSRRLIHERHELVREARHGAADADPADIRTPANSSHPAALSHVALHHRPPASEFHDARRRSVGISKLRLLVISASVASFVHGRS